MAIIIQPKEFVFVKVDYFLPDYNHILQEFMWQTLDFWPQIPRVQRFIVYWKKNINADIDKVLVQHDKGRGWTNVNCLIDF